MIKQHQLLLGAHLPISHGFDHALQESFALGCSTVQIFTKSNRQWYAKPLKTEEILSFENAKLHTSIDCVVAHASYLLNIGSSNELLRARSTQALVVELNRCTALSIAALVIHPGSHVNTNQQACLDSIVNSLKEVFEQYQGPTMVLLETMAGQGSTVCYTLEQLKYIVDRVADKKRLGICIDTCHLFAAGYELSTDHGYNTFWKFYDDILGIDSLKLIHLNDSKKTCGSRVDRHEHIGHGLLGIDFFRFTMNDPRFFDIPKIIETPVDDKGNYQTNITLLKSLISSETAHILQIKEKGDEEKS